MTIAVTSSYTRAPGNGVTTVFNFAFRVFAASDLVVRDILDSTGIPTTKALTTDYSVTISATGEGGSVTFNTAPASGHTIDIRSSIPLTQPADIRNQGSFKPELHETEFDRLARQNGDTRRILALAAQLPDSEIPPDWATILALANRKGKYGLFFNATTGAPELFTSIGATSLSQSVIGQFLYPQSAGELAAGKTPVNYFYPYGDVRRMGADATGSADSYQAIVDTLASGPLCYFPPGLYKVAQGPIVVTGDKIITGYQGGNLSYQSAQINHTAASGALFSATSTEFEGIYIGHLEIYGGNGSYAVVSTRPQSLFEHLHLEQSSTGSYNGGGIQLSFNPQGSFSTSIRDCKWVGPASQTAYHGFDIDVNGGLVELDNCTAIRGDIGVNVLRCEALHLKRINTNLQTSTYSNQTATAGQCGIRLSGSGNLRKSVVVEACYLEGATTQLWSDGHRSLEVFGGFYDDLGNGGSRDIYLKDANSVCTDIRGIDIRTRTAAKHSIENNGVKTVVENCTLNAEGGGGAAWLKTTTEVVHSGNNVIAGVLDDASGFSHDMFPTHGTWTPVVIGTTTPGTQTYSTQYGRYYKIGRMVFVEFSVAMTAKDGATAGNIRISGLPFTSRNNAASAPGGMISSFGTIDLSAGYSQLNLTVNTNNTVLSLFQAGDNVAELALPAAGLQATTLIRGSAWYET